VWCPSPPPRLAEFLESPRWSSYDESRVWSPRRLIYRAVERFGPDDLCDLISIRVVSNNDVHNVQYLQ
jgi:hypothetical protein